MKSNDILKLIEAGYTKAEIDAIMNDVDPNETEKTTEQKPETKTETETKPETKTEQKNETKTETKLTVNDNVSNAAILAALNTLNKNIQELNRNTTTSDGGTTPPSETTRDIMAKMFK